MLRSLSWLALEVKYLEPARRFYEETLSMTVRPDDNRRSMRNGPSGTEKRTDDADDESNTGQEIAFEADESDLVLRRPTGIPRGGLHTHFAFAIPAASYDDWWDRLEDAGYDLEEVQFGNAKSLYCYDPDGNCVELGQRSVAGPGIDSIFEVVLEVESLTNAEPLYAAMGFETVDRGSSRRRIRMNGPMALELWEPHLGIADARGGVHVDLGFEASDPAAVGDAVSDRVCSVTNCADGSVIIRDPDGHHLTIHRTTDR